MHWIGTIDSFSVLFSFAALCIICLRMFSDKEHREILVLISGLLIFNFIYCVFLFLQWTEINLNLDQFEDLSGAMIPMLWAFVFYIYSHHMAAHDLADSENELRTLFDSAHDGIQLLDGMKVIECNSTMVDVLDCKSKDEIIGFSPLDFSPDKQEDGRLSSLALEKYFAAACSGTPQSFTWQFFTKSGSEIDVEIALNKVILKEKEFLMAAVRDISQRKQAELALRENEQRLAILMGNLPGMAYRCLNDKDWTFIFASEGTYELTGYTAEELTRDEGVTYSQVIVEEDRDFVWEIIQKQLDKRKPFSLEYRIRTKTGDVKWVAEKGVGLFADPGGLVALDGFISDITSLKKAEEELRLSNDLLEMKVEERTAELKKAKEEAEAANRAKSLFLSKMSHEIRTPMNAILGFSQLLKRDPALTDSQDKYLTTINRSGEHLLALINDVLEMSKIEAGCIELQPSAFDYHRLIDDLINMFRIRTESKSLQLDSMIAKDVPQYLYCDQGKLREVLINIIGNAVKFTDQGGIVVRAAVQEAHGREFVLKVEVQDTGCGIADKDIEAVFSPFEQADSEHWHEGTGLGMSISRQFARLMGGDVTVVSRLGKGSSFTFTFNAEETSADQVKSVADECRQSILGIAEGQPEFTVMIADDDATNRRLLVSLLTSVGFKTCPATSGKEAIELFRKVKPDAILMDYHMPEVDGLEATRKIKALPDGKETPIIIVTASAMDESRDEALGAGADDFIRKPYLETDLLEAIKKFTGVEYIYSEQDKLNLPDREKMTMTSITEISEMVKELPDEFVDEMLKAVAKGDLNNLLKLTESPDLDPLLAGILRDRIEHFEYEKLKQILLSDKKNDS